MELITKKNGEEIIVETPMTKDEANEQYMSSHVDELNKKGFEDAGSSHASSDSLRTGLGKVKNDYLAWCAKSSKLYKESMSRREGSYRRLVSEYLNKEQAMKQQEEELEQQITDLKSQLDYTKGRNFMAQDLLKLLFNSTAIVILAFWLVYFYSSAFQLWQAAPMDLVDEEGNIILFSLKNIQYGWRFSMVPLSVAVAIGLFMKRNTPMRIGTSVGFAVMDLLFSIIIEQHLVATHDYLGISYSFSWLNVGLILFYGLIPSFVLAFFISRIDESVMFDGHNTGRAESKVLEDKIATLSEEKSTVHNNLGRVVGERVELETDLNRLMKDDITSLWFSGWVLDGLVNAYYQGWLRYVNARPDLSGDSVTSQEILISCKKVLDEFKSAA